LGGYEQLVLVINTFLDGSSVPSATHCTVVCVLCSLRLRAGHSIRKSRASLLLLLLLLLIAPVLPQS
jgi:hypothetical protein